jgi:signal transduction histidine kinase
MSLDGRTRYAIFAGVGIAATGLGLVAVTIFHLLGEHRRFVSIVLGGGFPLITALGTVYAGVWILRSDLSKQAVLRVVGWWVFGLLTTALMGITSIVYEWSHGVVLVDAVYIVANNMTAGAAGGLLIGYFYDRSRRRSEQLADERDRLANDRERLAVLNRVVRHDIRNDMAVVLGWLDSLEAHVDTEGEEALDRVRTASDHVVELTRTTRDYVEVVVGEKSPDLHPVSLSSVLDSEIQSRREAHPGASFVAAEFPDVTVRANTMLSSVLRNVLDNAVRHNDAACPTVEVTAERSGDAVVVSVADNGPGVPDERKEAVFGKDEQGIESPGTGIGLYLADALVSEYGGDIWVEDNEPEGAVFRIRLPVDECVAG